MKSWMIIATVFTGFVSGNGSLRSAWDFYQDEEYGKSIASYIEALKHYPEESTRIYYNLGLCFLELDSLGQAVNFFQRSSGGKDLATASMASNQMGVIMVNLYRNKDALGHFRKALVQNPDNEVARYNYELLKRRLGSDTNSNNSQREDEEPESQNPLTEEELNQLLDDINRIPISIGGNDFLAPQSLDSIPLPLAKRLLEERRRAETQFLQQKKKKLIRKSSEDNNPDW
ncbi:MAG: hypothetical protein MRZ79_12285 [Bacteroidia bacterium]|nr:hypothetical protein [Bacteroidia bacterium]